MTPILPLAAAMIAAAPQAPGPDRPQVWPDVSELGDELLQSARAVAFDPDGRTLVFVNRRYEIGRLDLPTGRVRIVSALPLPWPSEAVLSADGRRLLRVVPYREATVHDTRTGALVSRLDDGWDPHSDWHICDDGSAVIAYVIVPSLRNRMAVYDAATGRKRFERKHTDFRGAASDGTLLLTDGYGDGLGSLACRNGFTGKPLTGLDTPYYARAPAFAPDGRSLAVIDYSERDRPAALDVWDLGTGKRTVRRLLPEDWGWRTAFAPDGSLLAVGCKSAVRLLNAKTLETVVSTAAPWKGKPDGLRFSADGRWLLTSIAGRQRWYVWDLSLLRDRALPACIEALEAAGGWAVHRRGRLELAIPSPDKLAALKDVSSPAVVDLSACSGLKDADLRRLADYKALIGVVLPDGITDPELAHLTAHPNFASFRELDVSRRRPGRAVMQASARAAKLRRLVLGGAFDPAVAEALPALAELEELSASGPGVDDRFVAALGKSSRLRVLELRDSAVTDAGLAALAGVTALESLDLSGGRRFTGVGLTGLHGSAATMRELDLSDTAAGDAGLRSVAALTALETLCLPGGVGDAGVRELAPLRSLTALKVSDAAGLTGSGLAGLTALESLDLTGCGISDVGAEGLRPLTRLRRLVLDGTRLTDRGVPPLGGLFRLEALSLERTAVTSAALGPIRWLPKLRVFDADIARVPPEQAGDVTSRRGISHGPKRVASLGDRAAVTALFFPQDGRRLHVVDERGRVTEHDVDAPSAIIRTLAAEPGDKPGEYKAAVSADGSRVVFLARGLRSPSIRVLDVAAGKIRGLQDAPGLFEAPAFSADGRRLAVLDDEEILVFDAEAGRLLHKRPSGLLTGGWLPVAGLVDGGRTYALKRHGSIRLTSLERPDEHSWLDGHRGEIDRLAVSADGRWLASTADNDLRLWDMTTGTEVYRFGWGDTYAAARAVAFSRDGRHLAVAEGYHIHVIGVYGSFPRVLLRSDEEMTCVAFSPDGKTLAAAAGWRKSSLAVWDLAEVFRKGPVGR